MQGIVGLHEYVLGAYMHANGSHTNQYAITRTSGKSSYV